VEKLELHYTRQAAAVGSMAEIELSVTEPASLKSHRIADQAELQRRVRNLAADAIGRVRCRRLALRRRDARIK